jgi:hypothetical protein
MKTETMPDTLPRLSRETTQACQGLEGGIKAKHNEMFYERIPSVLQRIMDLSKCNI